MNVKSILKYLFIAGIVINFASCDDSGIITPVNGVSTGKYSKTYGGSASDALLSMIHTSDGGYLLGGFTISFGSGDNDVYAVKLKSTGEIDWSKTYGGTGNDQCRSVKQTTDGGYIFAGNVTSSVTDGTDILLVKTDATGNTTWSEIYKLPGDQYGNSVVEDNDGGFIVCGYTNQNAATNNDVLILKANSSGAFQWQKVYGEQLNDYGNRIIRTSDGGFIVAGYTFNYSAAAGDIYLMKLKADASLEWTKTYGGSGLDLANDILETTGHDFVVVGSTQSFGIADGDMFLFKTDHNGNVYISEGWPRTIGVSTGFDAATSVAQASDGSFYLTGFISNTPNQSIFFAHYFNNSVYDYSKSYNVTTNDVGSVIIPKTDGYIIGGNSGTIGSDVNFITIGMKDTNSTMITCLTDNAQVVNGGSPAGFDGVTAATQSYVLAGESDITANYTAHTAGTATTTQCTSQ